MNLRKILCKLGFHKPVYQYSLRDRVAYSKRTIEFDCYKCSVCGDEWCRDSAVYWDFDKMQRFNKNAEA